MAIKTLSTGSVYACYMQFVVSCAFAVPCTSQGKRHPFLEPEKHLCSGVIPLVPAHVCIVCWEGHTRGGHSAAKGNHGTPREEISFYQVVMLSAMLHVCIRDGYQNPYIKNRVGWVGLGWAGNGNHLESGLSFNLPLEPALAPCGWRCPIGASHFDEAIR
jgi:hypothetical protein